MVPMVVVVLPLLLRMQAYCSLVQAQKPSYPRLEELGSLPQLEQIASQAREP